jgi:hypothetical protein
MIDELIVRDEAVVGDDEHKGQRWTRGGQRDEGSRWRGPGTRGNAGGTTLQPAGLSGLGRLAWEISELGTQYTLF